MNVKIYREYASGTSEEYTFYGVDEPERRLDLVDVFACDMLEINRGNIKIIHIEVCE